MYKHIKEGNYVEAKKEFNSTMTSMISEAVEAKKLDIAESMGVVSEETDYDKFVKTMMSKKGIDSLDDLDKEEKKKFFDEIDSKWNSKDEKGKDGKVED